MNHQITRVMKAQKQTKQEKESLDEVKILFDKVREFSLHHNGPFPSCENETCTETVNITLSNNSSPLQVL